MNVLLRVTSFVYYMKLHLFFIRNYVSVQYSKFLKKLPSPVFKVTLPLENSYVSLNPVLCFFTFLVSSVLVSYKAVSYEKNECMIRDNGGGMNVLIIDLSFP